MRFSEESGNEPQAYVPFPRTPLKTDTATARALYQI